MTGMVTMPFPSRLIIGMALGILREPAAENTLLLGYEFVNCPEKGEGGCAQDGRPDGILHKQRKGCTDKSGNKQHPPALFAPIVFHFNDNRMADSDNQEHCSTNDYTFKVHSQLTHYNVQHHHQRKTQREADGTQIRVFALCGLRNQFFDDHVEHGAGGESQQVRHEGRYGRC